MSEVNPDSLFVDDEGEMGVEFDLPQYGLATLPSKTTTDAYTNLGKAVNRTPFRSGTILVQNTGAGGLHVRIMGSLNKGKAYDAPVLAETTVAAGASLLHNLSGFQTHLRVEVKAALAGTQTTTQGKIALAN